MSLREYITVRLDNFWFYSGLFGLFLLLHYFTPYFDIQPTPDFFRSVIHAPLFEEIIYRFLGILVAYLCINKIDFNERLSDKIWWGMMFILTVYLQLGSVILLRNSTPLEDNFATLILGILLLVIILIFKVYRLEILMLSSSLSFAFVHEIIRFIPVFLAGMFFSLLCVNRSRLLVQETRNRVEKGFLLIYGSFIGYLIHFWNNFLNWVFYQTLDPLIIDLLSLTGVILFLYFLEYRLTPIIDGRFDISSS